MKKVFFCVMITCWAAGVAAQQFNAGLSLGFRKSSSGTAVIDNVSLHFTNPWDERYLIPGIGYRQYFSDRWFLEADVQYQTASLSLQVSDPPLPGCILCPVRKGTLVSFNELFTGISGGFTFLKTKDWAVDMSLGVVHSFRFGIRQSPTDGLDNLSDKAREVLASGRSLVRKSYWNGRWSVTVSWRKWGLKYQSLFLISDSMTDPLLINGNIYPVSIDQHIRSVGVTYRFLAF